MGQIGEDAMRSIDEKRERTTGMRATARKLVRLLAFGLLVGSVGMTAACGGGKDSAAQDQDKKKEVVEKSRIEKLAEKTGVEQKAIEKFKEAQAELAKEKPDTEKAKKLLAEVIKLQDNFSEAHYNLGVIYSNREQADKALPHLQKAHDLDPGVLDYTVALAQAYASSEKFSQARDLFREVVSRQPNNLTAKNNLAVMALRQGDQETAMGHVRDVLREDNEDVGALNVMGLIYRKRGNLSLAKYAFQKGLRFEDGNADLHNNLGLVYLNEENVPAAVDSFARAIKANPNYLESRLNIGAILLDYLDYPRAYKQFSEAIRIAPNNCTAQLGHGATAYAVKKHEKSAKSYQYYVDNCDEDHVSSYERLATLYETQLKDKKKAISYYNRLLELCDSKDLSKEQCADYKATRNFLQNQAASEEPKKGGSEAEGESGESDESEPAESGAKEQKGSDKSEASQKEGASKEGGSSE